MRLAVSEPSFQLRHLPGTGLYTVEQSVIQFELKAFVLVQ